MKPAFLKMSNISPFKSVISSSLSLICLSDVCIVTKGGIIYLRFWQTPHAAGIENKGVFSQDNVSNVLDLRSELFNWLFFFTVWYDMRQDGSDRE